jgi:ankyrin repeat protein
MSPRPGTQTPNLEQQRKRAKDLRQSHERGTLDAGVRVVRHLPRARTLSPVQALASPLRLSEAQFIVAREAGFASWPDLKHALEGDAAARLRDLVLDAALAGGDDLIGEMLSRDPGLPHRSVHVAAAVVDPAAITAALDVDPSLVNATGGRRAWTPLLYLCATRARRDDIQTRLAAARLLLDRGARASGREPGWRSTHGTMLSPRHELLAVEAAAGGGAIPELVALLLDGGASLDETTVALVQAVRGGNPRVLELLLERLPSHLMWQVGWALRETVAADRVDMARLLARQANLPANAALRDAISAGSGVELLQILLGEKTDDRSSAARDEAYVLAVRHDYGAAAAWLLDRGANPALPSAEDFAIRACLAGSQESIDAGALVFEDEHHRMLSWAVRPDRIQTIPALLRLGLDPNVSALDGETPLRLAAAAGAAEAVDALLAAGARVTDVNFDGESALDAAVMSAATEARSQIVARLVAAGARPIDDETLPDREESDILFERAADAMAHGDVAALRMLLDELPSLAQARSPRPHRATLLHYCAANGVEEDRQTPAACDPDLLRLLLERGADPNATCLLYGGGATTLGLVLTSVQPMKAGTRAALAEALLRAGASIGGDRRGAPFVTAAALGDLTLVKRALTSPPGVARPSMHIAFWWACEFARTPVIACLLDHGIDLRAQNESGQTGLHLAALAGSMEAVRLLVARGAPLEIENTWGGTVLGNVLWAAVNYDPHVDYAPIVEALVAAGAVVDSGYLRWFRQQRVLRPDSKARIEAALMAGD